ncbi:MAG: hypothetical protein MR436_02460 [Eubacterium sp.]|nr:hypothetical protein [Eubacterium sp.]
MTLEEKLRLWVKITGVDPSENQTSYTIHFDGRLSSWDIERMNNHIKEALDYDESGLFAEAYLTVYFEEYIKKRQMTLCEILTNEQVKEFMTDAGELYRELKRSDCSNRIMKEACQVMDFYGLNHDQLGIFDVAELRTSATRCMAGKLRRLQFSSGKPSSEGFKMTQSIYMYKNLDALLLCAANNTIDGVSLGYIRDEEQITDSYFAFIIKNGQNLYLLTDMPHYKNPLQNRMTRCPGRNMHDRINSNFFPYQTVANIDTSDLWGSGRYGTSETSTELSEQTDYVRIKIGTFESMDEQEAFWTVMMLSMIQDEFYKKVPQYEISYTGSMIQSAQIPSSTTALTIRSVLPVMELSDISIKDTMDLEYEQRKEVNGINDYLLERYRNQLDNSAFNLIRGTEKFEIADNKYSKETGFFHDKRHLMVPFDLNMCGTQKEILDNQKFIERYNYSAQIQVLADKDFEENKQEIYRTVQNYIDPRIRELCKMHLLGQLKGIHHVFDSSKEFGCFTDKEISISKMDTFDRWYDGTISSRYRYGYTVRSTKADMRCAFTGKAPGVVIKIMPANIQEVAMVCGCTVQELPEQIQHWKESDRYVGNPILQNIDPLLWNIIDPFEKMDFGITILLSKKEYLAICSEAGVKQDKFWEATKPVCFNCGRDNDKYCRGKYRYNWTGSKVEHDLIKKCKKCKWYKKLNHSSP